VNEPRTRVTAEPVVPERCDRCGARAVKSVHILADSLFFCGHHFRSHEPEFAMRGYEVRDVT
jgi:hypothetical protein